MTSLKNCPSLDQLRELLAGRLPDPPASSLETHLLECSACLERTTLCRTDDALLSALRGAEEHCRRASPNEQELIDGLISSLGGLTTVIQTGLSRSEPLSVTGLIGDYEILNEIARGGMGVVYKARHRELGRLAAVKLIRSGELAHEDEVRRFQAEARAAARLDHHGIVPVFEVGQQGSQHFMAMAYIEGQSLWQQVKEAPLEPRHAARLMQQVAEAVQFAHDHGIIHRDLKPQNILLTVAGEPKVTDFGLAKNQAGDASLTGTGDVLGTPSYMPPEQATGKHAQVGPLADVYSLGATLYCLLTGRPPFQAANTLETLLQVVEQEPVPPRQLNRSVPGDLETICLKCLEKDPDRRYATASAFAADLGHFQRGEPILARPVSGVEHAWRWCRRNPVVAALTSAAAILLVAIAIVSTLAYTREANLVTEKDGLITEKDGLITQKESLIAEKEELIAEMDDLARKERRLAEEERAAQIRATDNLYTAHMNLVQRAWEQAEIEKVREMLVKHIPKPGEPDRRAFEWYYYWNELHSAYATLDNLPGAVRAVAYSHDGKWLAIGCEDGLWKGHVLLWETASQKPPRVIEEQPQAVFALACQPNGPWLAYTSGRREQPGVVRLRNIETGEIKDLKGHRFPVMALAFSPDGQTLATAGLEQGRSPNGYLEHARGLILDGTGSLPDGLMAGEVLLWDVTEGVARPSADPTAFRDRQVCSLAFSADGTRLFGGTCKATVLLWDHVASKLLVSSMQRPLSAPIHAIVPRADGSTVMIATGTTNTPGRGICLRHDDALLRMVFEFGTHRMGMLACTAAKDNLLMATGGFDREAKVWAWGKNGYTEYTVMRGHTAPIQGLAFSPDASMLATGSWDRSVKLWSLARPPQYSLVLNHASNWTGPSPQFFDKSERQLYCMSRSDSRQDRALVLNLDDYAVRESRSVDTIYALDQGNILGVKQKRSPDRIQVFDPLDSTMEIKHETSVSPDVDWAMLTPNGKWLITQSTNAERRIAWTCRELSNGEVIGDYREQPGQPITDGMALGALIQAKVSPDSQRLFVTTGHNQQILWQLPQMKLIAARQSKGYIVGNAFSSDRRLLAVVGENGHVELLDGATFRSLHLFPSDSNMNLFAATFSPDDRLLVTAGRDRRIKLWDVAERRERLTLRGPDDVYRSLLFSPDGKMLIAGGDYGSYGFFGQHPRDQDVITQPPVSEPGIPRLLRGSWSIRSVQQAHWHKLRTIIASKQKEAVTALFHCDFALVELPDDPTLHSLRAQAFSQLNHLDEAERALARAISLGPPDIRLQLLRVQLLVKQSRTEQLRDFAPELVTQFDHSGIPLLQSRFAFSLALDPHAMKNWKPVADLAEKALTGINNFEAIRAAALSNLRAHRIDLARQRACEALEMQPSSYSAKFIALLVAAELPAPPDDSPRFQPLYEAFQVYSKRAAERGTREFEEATWHDVMASVRLAEEARLVIEPRKGPKP